LGKKYLKTNFWKEIELNDDEPGESLRNIPLAEQQKRLVIQSYLNKQYLRIFLGTRKYIKKAK